MLVPEEIQPTKPILDSSSVTLETEELQFRYEALVTEIVRGTTIVCDWHGRLSTLAKRSGYTEALADLPYFVNKPGVVEGISAKISQTNWPGFLKPGLSTLVRRLIKREPILVVVSAPPAENNSTAEDMAGAILVFEYRVLGLRSRFVTTNDRSGKQCFVAMNGAEPAILDACIEALCADGANLLLLAIHREDGQAGDRLLSQLRHKKVRHRRSAVRERRRKSFMPLLGTVDDTYAQLGRKTRKNLGYYKRLAEKELGATFEEQVQLDLESFLAINRRCMYAVPEDVARWRHACLSDLPSAFMSGVKDRDGNWLSLIGCRRWGTTVEILWQMNIDGYRDLSLAIVARSFLIESEIALGSTRLQIEGGAAHSLYGSFEEENILDFVRMRETLAARMLRFATRRVVQDGDELGLMLSHSDLDAPKA